MLPSDAKAKYNVHKQDAKRRGIAFNFSFEEWSDWWERDDRWSRRGRGSGKLVMARFGDQGPYEPGNVYCATHGQNAADSAGSKRSEATRRFHENRTAAGVTPTLAVRGAGHPRSRAVVTPAGEFQSGALAADHYGVTKEAIYNRISKGHAGYRWKEHET